MQVAINFAERNSEKDRLVKLARSKLRRDIYNWQKRNDELSTNDFSEQKKKNKKKNRSRRETEKKIRDLNVSFSVYFFEKFEIKPYMVQLNDHLTGADVTCAFSASVYMTNLEHVKS